MVKSGGVVPALICADRGTETWMIADTHYKLSLAAWGDDETDFVFGNCF